MLCPGLIDERLLEVTVLLCPDERKTGGSSAETGIPKTIDISASITDTQTEQSDVGAGRGESDSFLQPAGTLPLAATATDRPAGQRNAPCCQGECRRMIQTK